MKIPPNHENANHYSCCCNPNFCQQYLTKLNEIISHLFSSNPTVEKPFSNDGRLLFKTKHVACIPPVFTPKTKEKSE